MKSIEGAQRTPASTATLAGASSVAHPYEEQERRMEKHAREAERRQTWAAYRMGELINKVLADVGKDAEGAIEFFAEKVRVTPAHLRNCASVARAITPRTFRTYMREWARQRLPTAISEFVPLAEALLQLEQARLRAQELERPFLRPRLPSAKGSKLPSVVSGHKKSRRKSRVAPSKETARMARHKKKARLT